MDITLYQSMKDNEDAPVSLKKLNRLYAIEIPKFDPANGREIDPELVTLKRENAVEILAELESRVASVRALLADMDALDAAAGQ